MLNISIGTKWIEWLVDFQIIEAEWYIHVSVDQGSIGSDLMGFGMFGAKSIIWT